MKFRFKAILVFFLTALFCLYPPLRNYKQNDIKAAFDYFAADAFYYLNVADKYQKTGFSSFDGIHPTNGFHPLWQNLLNFSFSIIKDKESQIRFVFFLSLCLVSLGFGFISIGLLKIYDSIEFSLLASIPGFIFIIFSFILFPYASPWAFMNGMETPLSVFLFGLLLLFLAFKKNSKKWNSISLIIISILLTLISFARLDDFFLLMTVTAFMIMKSEKAERLKTTLLLLILPVVGLILYFLYNYLYSGLILPVSGLVKSNFSFDNILFTITSIISFGVQDNFSGEHAMWRVILLFFPLICASTYIYKSGFNSSKDFIVLIPFSLYVILKAVYNLFFVNFWDQGHWYFAISIIISNILIINFLQNLQWKKRNSIATVFALLVVIFIFANFYMEKYRFKENKYYEFWQKRHKIEKQISEIYDGKGIIEFDDGVIAWSLHYPALSGTGLNLDKEAYDYYKNGEFLDLAEKHGYSAMASILYINPPDEVLTDSVKFNNWIKNSFPALKRQKVENWKFSLKFYDKETNFYLVGIYKNKKE